MPLIKNRQLQAEDAWQFLQVTEEQPELPPRPWGDAVVLPADKLAEVDLSGIPALGARLTTEQDHELLLPFLDRLQLIAIDFLAFRDGRGFSQAHLLRRAGFLGELRAIGFVARDRLAYLESCGFDAFLIPEERFKPEDLQAFTEIHVSYQKPVDSQAGAAGSSHVA